MMWFFAGILGLAVLDAVVSSPQAGARAGGILGLAVGVVNYIVDPSKPGLPDRRVASSSTTTVTKPTRSAGAVVVNPAGTGPANLGL